MKQENYNGYKVGAAKRKFKLGRDDFAPGTLIAKMNEQKQKKESSKTISATLKVALEGAV